MQLLVACPSIRNGNVQNIFHGTIPKEPIHATTGIFCHTLHGPQLLQGLASISQRLDPTAGEDLTDGISQQIISWTFCNTRYPGLPQGSKICLKKPSRFDNIMIQRLKELLEDRRSQRKMYVRTSECCSKHKKLLIFCQRA